MTKPKATHIPAFIDPPPPPMPGVDDPGLLGEWIAFAMTWTISKPV
jgi:hypothetical protein